MMGLVLRIVVCVPQYQFSELRHTFCHRAAMPPSTAKLRTRMVPWFKERTSS
jgi:hypothetical protein